MLPIGGRSAGSARMQVVMRSVSAGERGEKSTTVKSFCRRACQGAVEKSIHERHVLGRDPHSQRRLTSSIGHEDVGGYLEDHKPIAEDVGRHRVMTA